MTKRDHLHTELLNFKHGGAQWNTL